MSYAQVLKTAVKHKAADARTDGSINIKAGKVAANNESVIGTHMHQTFNKVFTGCNYKYGGHKVKAKCSKGQLEVNHQQSGKNDIQCKIGLPLCQSRKSFVIWTLLGVNM